MGKRTRGFFPVVVLAKQSAVTMAVLTAELALMSDGRRGTDRVLFASDGQHNRQRVRVE
jgi:hypothetical protein